MARPAKSQSDPAEASVAQLREYEILKKLGRGGMGIVYLVRHRLTQRNEVLKILRPELAARPRLRERFLREVQAAARLDHPNVVKTFNAIENGELLGLVMEHVEGQDLETLVHRSGPLTVAAAASVIRQAALGLQHAADRGLIHRDIKPSNILVTRSEGQLVAKLSDFGLSKLHDQSDDNSLTVAGGVLGTPDYMAPEQALSPGSATVAADIYGLGCALHYALIGKPPYSGGNALAVLNAHLSAPLPDVCQLRHDIPAELGSVFQRMLQKEPSDRYATPTEVARALEPFLHSDRPIAGSASTTLVEAIPISPSSPSSPSLVRREPPGQASEYVPPSRKRAGVRRERQAAPLWQTLIQVAMPLALVAALVYFKPWGLLNRESSGALLLKEMTPGTTIEIDGTLTVVPDANKTSTEVRLASGPHKLRVMHGQQTVAHKSFEISAGSTMELSVSITGVASAQNRRIRPPAAAAVAPRQSENADPRPQPMKPAAPRQLALEPPVAEPPVAEPSQPERPASQPSLPAKAGDDANTSVQVVEKPIIELINPSWSLELERELSGRSTRSTSLTIIPRDITAQGNELIVALASGASAWDAKTGFSQSIFTPFPVDGISVASNEKSVLYFDAYRCEVWALQNNKPTRWFWPPATSNVKRVFAISSDCRYLASCGYDESLIRWDLSTKAAVSMMSARHPLTSDRVQNIVLTARLDKVLALGKDGVLNCWDASDGEQLGRVEATGEDSSNGPLAGLYINNAARKVIAVSQKGDIAIRRLPTLESTARVQAGSEDIVKTAYSGRLLALADFQGTITLLDTQDWTPIGTIKPPNAAQVASIAISPDSKCIAIAYSSGAIHVSRVRKSPSAASAGAPPSPPDAG